MTQRSSGIFPREKFDIDATMEVTTIPSDLPIDAASISIIRVIVLNANLGIHVLTVTIGGREVVFGSNDIDGNGVGIAYLRGTLCADSEAVYTITGGTVDGVYVDTVDNVG